MKKVGGRELVVFVTTSSKTEAKAIAKALLSRKLAACVTMVGLMESLYRWKGKIQQARETMIMIKTTGACWPDLERQVKDLHSYEVPEIIALPISAGSRDYLSWVRNETVK